MLRCSAVIIYNRSLLAREFDFIVLTILERKARYSVRNGVQEGGRMNESSTSLQSDEKTLEARPCWCE